VFRVVQRRTMSHTDMGIVGATTDTFILFENGVRRNWLVLPGLSVPSMGTAVLNRRLRPRRGRRRTGSNSHCRS
jgi:hypothetical protein